MATRPTTPSRATVPLPSSAPRPVQFTPLRKEDLASDGGMTFVNQTLSQLTTTLNALVGQGGPTQFPAGVDMAGSTLTGLATPSSPTDAISAGHASSQYSAAAQQPQLDIGGDYTLKGLTYSYQQASQVPGMQTQISSILTKLAAGVTGTISLAKLTTGGTNGSITVSGGLITGFVNPT